MKTEIQKLNVNPLTALLSIVLGLAISNMLSKFTDFPLQDYDLLTCFWIAILFFLNIEFLWVSASQLREFDSLWKVPVYFIGPALLTLSCNALVDVCKTGCATFPQVTGNLRFFILMAAFYSWGLVNYQFIIKDTIRLMNYLRVAVIIGMLIGAFYSQHPPRYGYIWNWILGTAFSLGLLGYFLGPINLRYQDG